MQNSSDPFHTHLSVQPAGSLRGHDWEISIWLSPDGQRLLSTTQTNEDHTVFLWDTVAQKRLKVLEGHQRQVLECAYAHDSKSFATACDDWLVRFWTADGDLLMGLPGHERGARGVAFVSSSLLLTCDNTGIVRLWDLSTRQVLLSQSGSPDQDDAAALSQHTSPPLHPMTYAPEHGLLAINHPSASGNVHLWSVDREQCSLRWLGTSFTSDCEEFAFSADGCVLALLGDDLRLRIGPFFASEIRLSLPASWHFLQATTVMSLSPDGRYLAIGDYDGEVGFWDLRKQVPVGRFRAYMSLNRWFTPMDSLTGISWSGSGLLATAGWDPIEDVSLLKNNFVVTLWHVEIAEEGERE